MKIRFRILSSLIILMVLVANCRLSGQRVYGEGKPDGIKGINLSEEWYELAFNKELIDSLTTLDYTKGTPFRFAVSEQVAISPSNSGITIQKENETVWYMPFRSEGARSLNIIFSHFSLRKGESLYLYDSDLRVVRGPFTGMNNNDDGILAILPVPGDELIIEYHMPGINRGEVEVGQVSHDFIGIMDNADLKDAYFGDSGPCNIDINCVEGDPWQVEKRSVVRIFVNGESLGTGTLINNTNQENIPYVLTAEHVVSTSFLASRSVYVFGYESPWCDGPDGSTGKSISGSSLVSAYDYIDLSLVKLSSFPPITYKPYLAGWDARAIVPDQQVSIHHPSADVKKISIDLDPPVISTYPDLKPNGFWKILQWDFGTTEGGSSGAPLFNQDHRVVGHLTGGEAYCGRSVNDYFARFDTGYDLSADIFKSMKAWLDPAQSGQLILDGRDPYKDNFTLSDTLFNYHSGDTLLTPYELPYTGYTTGFNSDSIMGYSELFNYSGIGYITEIRSMLGDMRYISATDSVTFFVFGESAGLPAEQIARKGFTIKGTKDSLLLVIDFELPVTVKNNFFIGYRIWYTQIANSESQQFAIYHSIPSLPSENSAFFLDTDGWHPFTEHPFYPTAANLIISAVVLKDAVYNNVTTTLEESGFKIFPNPFTDYISILVPSDYHSEAEISIHDIRGGLIIRRKIFLSGEVKITVPGNPGKGIYFLSIRTPAGIESFKLIR